jgi:hypothetical protein
LFEARRFAGTAIRANFSRKENLAQIRGKDNFERRTVSSEKQPHASAHVEASGDPLSVSLVLGVWGCPVPGQLECRDDVADGAGV